METHSFVRVVSMSHVCPTGSRTAPGVVQTISATHHSAAAQVELDPSRTNHSSTWVAWSRQVSNCIMPLVYSVVKVGSPQRSAALIVLSSHWGTLHGLAGSLGSYTAHASHTKLHSSAATGHVSQVASPKSHASVLAWLSTDALVLHASVFSGLAPHWGATT